jgi:hypothetical protein
MVVGIFIATMYFKGFTVELFGTQGTLPAVELEATGISFKTAVKIGFALAAGLIILFAIASEGGFGGEIETVVVFFLIFWAIFSTALWFVF